MFLEICDAKTFSTKYFIVRTISLYELSRLINRNGHLSFVHKQHGKKKEDTQIICKNLNDQGFTQ